MTFDRFVGLPWREKGRGPDGYDCWGLAKAAWASRGIIVPSYAADYAHPTDEAVAGLVADHRSEWLAVPAGKEQPWDGVLFREKPWHIGLVVGAGMMLHMPRGLASRIERYTTDRWQRRLDGFYRYQPA